jgi:hypothetical protein
MSSFIYTLRLGGLYGFRRKPKQVSPLVGDLNQGCKGPLCDPPSDLLYILQNTQDHLSRKYEKLLENTKIKDTSVVRPYSGCNPQKSSKS